jgi:aryl-alcohol dehydrogenase-like predicted oxidoreductase
VERRALGKSGLFVAPLIFGGNVFGWTADERSSHALLDAFCDAGFNGVDTADVYSRWYPGNQGGESETFIGTWLKARGRRRDLVLITKCGMATAIGQGLSRAHILRSAEASLQRLQTDHIDVYMAHIDDTATALDETLEAFALLLRQGKARAIGASNYGSARLRDALDASRRLGLPRYEVLEPHYNLLERDKFEGPLQTLCLQEGIGVIPYFALASGFLTGKYRSEQDLERAARGSRVRQYLHPRGLRIVAILDEAARSLGATAAQVALAWLLARPGVTAPIVSASNPRQLAEILPAVALRLGGWAEKLDEVSQPAGAAAA